MKKGNKWIVILILLLLAAGIAFYGYSKKEKSQEKIYKTIQVIRGNIEKTILTTGLVQPYNRLEIKPPVAGRIDEVLVVEGQKVVKGQTLAFMSSTDRAALLDAARSKGADELKHWESYYKPTPIIAPLDGVIIAKNIQNGQTVTQQDAVLVMSDRLIVKAQVVETDIGEVKLKQKTVTVLDAYPRDELKGHVDHIAYEAKVVNNVTVYEVDVITDEVPDFMRSGMTANVTFDIGGTENVLVLPARAVEKEQNKNFVLIPNPDEPSQPFKQAVELGLSDGKKVEILKGLQEGDRVLVKNIPEKIQSSKTQTSPLSPMGGRSRR